MDEAHDPVSDGKVPHDHKLHTPGQVNLLSTVTGRLARLDYIKLLA